MSLKFAAQLSGLDARSREKPSGSPVDDFVTRLTAATGRMLQASFGFYPFADIVLQHTAARTKALS